MPMLRQNTNTAPALMPSVDAPGHCCWGLCVCYSAYELCYTL